MLSKVILICFVMCVVVSIFTLAQKPTSSIRFDPVQFDSKSYPDIDMFIGNWKESVPRYIYGSLEVRDILTRCSGDPMQPTVKGAVLTDILSLSYASLEPHTSTIPLMLVEEQHIFYINSGKGIIKSGSKTANLVEGIGVLMPPGIKFTITNAKDEPLTMYLIAEPLPEEFNPNKEMVVKNEYDNQISTDLRRVDSNNWLFSRNDGLSTLTAINPVMYEPMSYVQPHVHPVGVEEVWFVIKGDILILLGKQRRKLHAGSAYKVPANGITPHANINNTNVSKKLMWMMKVPVNNNPSPLNKTI